MYPTASPTWLNALDQGVFNSIFSLFAGKAYAIFALLFGFTFYLQSNNRKQQGKDFGYRFLWRMVLLVGFATLNAAFFPAGDVLLLFAVVSLVLFFTRNWSDKAVFVTAILFLLQPVEWYHYIAHLLNPAHQLPDLHVNEMYAEVAEYTKAGDFGGTSPWGRKPACSGQSMPGVSSRLPACSSSGSTWGGNNGLSPRKTTCAYG